jgi:hypothetical protein
VVVVFLRIREEAMSDGLGYLPLDGTCGYYASRGGTYELKCILPLEHEAAHHTAQFLASECVFLRTSNDGSRSKCHLPANHGGWHYQVPFLPPNATPSAKSTAYDPWGREVCGTCGTLVDDGKGSA